MKPLQPAQGPSSTNPLGLIRADTVNEALAELIRQSKISVDGGLEYEETGSGRRLTLPAGWIWIWGEITAEGTGARAGKYAWREKKPAAGGTFTTLEGGHTGTVDTNSATDPNGVTGIANGTIVLLVKGQAALNTARDGISQDWLIVGRGAGGAGVSGFPFPARLDTSSGRAHGWTEMEKLAGGTFGQLAGGRTGTPTRNPAYEINGGQALDATSPIVWMFPGYSGEYLFQYDGSKMFLGIGANWYSQLGPTIPNGVPYAIPYWNGILTDSYGRVRPPSYDTSYERLPATSLFKIIGSETKFRAPVGGVYRLAATFGLSGPLISHGIDYINPAQLQIVMNFLVNGGGFQEKSTYAMGDVSVPTVHAGGDDGYSTVSWLGSMRSQRGPFIHASGTVRLNRDDYVETMLLLQDHSGAYWAVSNDYHSFSMDLLHRMSDYITP